jgi:hypothetical protein
VSHRCCRVGLIPKALVEGEGGNPWTKTTGWSSPDRSLQDRLVAAFLAAPRGGDFEALLAVLDPDVVLRADETAVGRGAPGEARGAGAVWMAEGRPRVVFDITAEGDKIVAIDLMADTERLGRLDLVLRGEV